MGKAEKLKKPWLTLYCPCWYFYVSSSFTAW